MLSMFNDVFVDTVGCADPDECREVCDIESGCTNIAYPMLVLELMPTGWQIFANIFDGKNVEFKK